MQIAHESTPLHTGVRSASNAAPRAAVWGVRACGVYNFVVATSFLVPGLPTMIDVAPPDQLFYLYFSALALAFFGAILLYAAANLRERTPLVFLEGLTRMVLGTLLVMYGLNGVFGPVAIGLGVIDLVFAAGYYTLLPLALGRSLRDLIA